MRALAAVLLCGACTTPSENPRYESGDPTPLQLSLASDPPATAAGVARDATLRVVLDDYPDPDTAIFGAILLRSGRVNLDADLRIDFVGRAITLKPRALLLPFTTYEVIIDPAVRSLSGRVPAEMTILRFDTADLIAGPPPPRPRRVWKSLANPPEEDLEDVIGACAPACHTRTGCDGMPRPPARELDFEASPYDPIYGMVNVQSVGLRGTPRPLLRVAPFEPARSVLLRKLLGGSELGTDGRRMPIPVTDCKNVATPPPLDERSLRLVQDWIEDGAPLH